MIQQRSPLFIGIVLGLVAGVYMIFLSSFDIGADFKAYYYAARAWLNGGNIYSAASPTDPGKTFVYLPATLLWFLPFGLFPEWWQAYLFIFLISVIGSIWFAHMLIGVIEDRGVMLSRIDKGLIVSFLTLSTFSVPNLLHGQINLLLGVAIGAGLIAQVEKKPRLAGLLIGLAATIKLFPTIIGVWFLYKRDWQALGAAILTGLAHIILSVVVFGRETTATFFFEIIPQRFAANSSGGFPPDQSMITIRQPLSNVFGLNGVILSLVALTIGGIIVLSIFRFSDETLTKILALVIAMLISLPSYFIYTPIVIFPIVPLLYLRGDWVYSIGFILLTATFSLTHINSVLKFLPAGIFRISNSIIEPLMSIAYPSLIGSIILLIWAMNKGLHNHRIAQE